MSNNFIMQNDYISQSQQNPMNYTMPNPQMAFPNNLYNNNFNIASDAHSTSSHLQGAQSNYIIQNQQNIMPFAEKNIEVNLNMVVKSTETDARLEPMHVAIKIIGEKQQTVQIQVTSPSDPLILYQLDISEIEFHQLKEEQSLLLDFQNFPSFLGKMLTLCVNDKNNFLGILQKTSSYDGLLIIQEKTQFRKLNHLVLKINQANDVTLKKYLSGLSQDFKDKYENTLNSLNNLKTNFGLLKQENLELTEKLQKLELEKQNSLDNLNNEKNKEINQLKENSFKESKIQLENLENDKNKKIKELENKVQLLQDTIDSLNKTKQDLEDNKLKLEMSQKDLEGKHAISNTELNVYKEDLTNLRQENQKLNEKIFNQEKTLTELKFKSENLQKQIEEKAKSTENLEQLVDTLTKQRESNEDSIKTLKASNAKLEDKLQTSINEINKGNEIIEKLQNEIKNQKSKNKGTKQALQSQEQLTTQKQILLDEQIRNLNDMKRELDLKEREITGLKNQLANCNIKLNENEKIIEDNKNMILYLNKNINDNMTSPFRNRLENTNNSFQGTFNNTVNLNNLQGIPMNNNLTTGNLPNTNQSNNIPNMTNTFNQNQANLTTQMQYKIQGTNSFSNTLPNYHANVQNNNISNEPVNYLTDIENQNFNNSNNNFNNNYLQSSNNMQSSMGSGMIMPETNFCNYQNSAKLNSNMDKYLINNSSNGNQNMGSGNLLSHKYGNSASLSANMNGNEGQEMGSVNSIRSGFDGMNSVKNYNIEEEYPRQLTQPQNPVIKK